MIRTDIYIQAPTQDALLADLNALGYVEEGEVRFPDGCACVLADQDASAPAVMLVRCADAVAAVLLGAASEVVDFQDGFPVFGGGRLVEDAAAVAAARRAEILVRLAEIDEASVRPLRAQAAGTATAEDADRLAALEAQAAALREELASLG